MSSVFIRRSLLAIGFAAVVAAFALVALPYFASTRIVRDRIAWEMSAWSGFRVAIDGTPQIQVWPKFQAILTDVTLSKWSQPDGPPVIDAERVEIDLSAMAAVRGDIVFSTARLIRPTLRVDRTAKGFFLPALPSGGRITRSIDTARGVVGANPANPDASRLPDDPFGTVEFSDGRVVTTADGKETEILTSLNGRLDWATLNGSGALSANGIWNGESVNVDIASAKPLVLFAGGTAPLTVSVKSTPATFSFDGSINISDNSYIDGTAKFSAPSLRRALDWSGAATAAGGAAIGALSVSSKVNGSMGRLKLDSTEISLDKNPGMGALDFSFSEPVPVVAGTLAFETLDLRAFLAAFTPIAVPGGPAQQEPSNIAGNSRINLDLRLSAASATAGAVQMTDVAATAQVKDSLSVFDISDATAFGGTVQASLRFDRKPEGTQAEIKLLASDIDGAAFGAAAGMQRLVPTAKGTVSVILKGPGRTWDGILDNADGSINANFGSGSLSGLNLPAFLKRSQEGGFFPLDEVADGSVPIDGAELKATIAKGVARLDKAEANSPQQKIWLSGIVPYAGRGLALFGGIAPRNQPTPPAETANGQPAGPRQASFFVGGSWNAPFISPINREQSAN